MYTADGQIKIRNAAGGRPANVPFSATLTVRRPVINKRRTAASTPWARSRCAASAPGDLARWAERGLRRAERRVGDEDRPGARAPDQRQARDGSPQFTPDGAPCTSRPRRATPARWPSTRSRSPPSGARGWRRSAPSRWSRRRCRPPATASPTPPARASWRCGTSPRARRRPVIAQVSSQVSTPSWLPDGKRVVLVDNERMNNRFREGYNKLRVIDLAAKTGTFYPVAEEPRRSPTARRAPRSCRPTAARWPSSWIRCCT
jgi:hypothetical protein